MHIALKLMLVSIATIWVALGLSSCPTQLASSGTTSQFVYPSFWPVAELTVPPGSQEVLTGPQSAAYQRYDGEVLRDWSKFSEVYVTSSAPHKQYFAEVSDALGKLGFTEVPGHGEQKLPLMPLMESHEYLSADKFVRVYIQYTAGEKLYHFTVEQSTSGKALR